MNLAKPMHRDNLMRQTYQNITNLMDYWSADLQTNTQTALQHIQAGNLDSAIGCLLRNRETLKILDALHESLFTIHRRG